MAGELNGTDCVIALDVADNATFVAIGGLTTNGLTLNNTPIDITNKSTGSWRTLLGSNSAGEGLQAMSITGEVVFNSDAAFVAMKQMALDKTIKALEIDRGGSAVTGDFMIASYAETSPDNDKVTATVTFESSGAITGL